MQPCQLLAAAEGRVLSKRKLTKQQSGVPAPHTATLIPQQVTHSVTLVLGGGCAKTAGRTGPKRSLLGNALTKPLSVCAGPMRQKPKNFLGKKPLLQSYFKEFLLWLGGNKPNEEP